MYIKSSAFKTGQDVPDPYTCNDRNISPPLEFGDIPEDALSLVLTFEDIDAEGTPWVHWLLFNIPPSTTSIPEDTIPAGGTEGMANGGTHGYEGPCPKYFNGTHHYVFTSYALDGVLPLDHRADKSEVMNSMQGHVIGQVQLIGTKVGDGSAVPDNAGSI